MLGDPGTVTQEPRSHDWGLNIVRNWHLHFCMRPQTCFLSGKQLWFKQCYKGFRIITGPGESVEDYYYVEKNEFIIWNLRGKR
jgi:hypothetical protein